MLFDLPHSCSAIKGRVPVYDAVLCRGGLYVALVGPYYSRVGMEGYVVRIDGRRVDWWIEDDPEHFAMVAFCDVPPQSRGAASVMVEIDKRGETVWRGVVGLAVGTPGRVSIATLARFDWPWIAEWVDHHARAGVEHFYIYTNSEPRIAEALGGRINTGLVDLIPWDLPYKLYLAEHEPFWPLDSHWYAQAPQMMHAVLKYGDRWEWMGFFDADEFLVPRPGETVDSILAAGRWRADRPMRRVGALRVQGKWFGNAGHHEVPKGSVLQNYQRCERGYTSGTKCFVRPAAVKSTRIHWWEVEGETILVDPELLGFNHYRGISGHNVRRAAEFDREYTNETEDNRILQWNP